MHAAVLYGMHVGQTMEVLALAAALAVAGSPSLWAMSMADMGATSTGIDSFLPAKATHMSIQHAVSSHTLKLEAMQSCTREQRWVKCRLVEYSARPYQHV